MFNKSELVSIFSFYVSYLFLLLPISDTLEQISFRFGQ